MSASNPFFTNEEMVSILSLDSDFLDDPSNADRLQNLSLAASDFLLNRTGHDWSVDIPKNPTAYNTARLYVIQSFHLGTEISDKYDYSIGISANLIDLINIVRREKNGVHC